MREAVITLDSIDPLSFYGPNDSNLEVLRKQFPKIKIVARGNEIKLFGDELDLNIFNEKILALLDHFKRFGYLDDEAVAQIARPTDTTPVTEGEPKIGDILVYGPNGLLVKARTANQRKMVSSCDKNDIIFAIGPAGTGKTYTAVALAVRALKNREIKRIILTRPAVEAGENLGFLPGDLKEKIDPYLRPLYDALFDMIPGEKVKTFLENGIIEVAPLAFMRGRTLDNAFVILDEAQNATESQLKMFLTRMGPSAKFIVTGDVTQVDLPRNQPSGLVQAIKMLKSIKGIDFIELDEQDVVRHKLVKEIILAYNKAHNA